MKLIALFLLLAASETQAQTQAQCTAGQYWDANAGACIACAVGFYQDLAAQTSCKSCPPGTGTLGQGTSQFSSCFTECQAGEFYDTGDTLCRKCANGQYSTSGKLSNGIIRTLCDRCPDDRPITPEEGSDEEADCRAQCPDGQQWVVTGGTATCTACGTGFYRSASIRRCVQCAVGTTTLQTGSTTSADCVATCPAGAFRNSNSQCQSCPLGSYSTASESASCTQCGDGTTTRAVAATSRDACVAECEAGTYITGSTCTPCSAGQYQANREATACNSCPPNFSGPVGATSQNDCYRVCPVGQYLSSGNCVQCALGFYQSETGKTSCNSCGSSKTTRSLGSDSINDCVDRCRAGTYIDGSTCTACGVGSYSENEESVSCQRCADGFTTRNAGSDESTDCIPDCAPGTYISSSVCTPCPQGTYQTERQAPGCVRCASGKTTLNTGESSRDACITACYKGTYYDSATDSCIDCPPGQYQDEDFQTSCKSCTAGFTTYADANGRFGADSVTRCLSTNECSINRDNCNINADCRDLPVGFNCTCKLGFVGDGVVACNHRCVVEPGYCVHGTCEPITSGVGVRCDCDSGYTGDRCLDKTTDDVDTDLILAAVLGTVGGLFLLALLGLLIYCLCCRRTYESSKTIVEESAPTYIQQAPQQKIVERIYQPKIIREPRVVEKEIYHDVPARQEHVVVEHVYEQAPQVQMVSQPALLPPPAYAPVVQEQQVYETKNFADLGVPNVPQTIQTEHGVATLVSAGQPVMVGQMPSVIGQSEPVIIGQAPF